jgi:hypothetical protein
MIKQYLILMLIFISNIINKTDKLKYEKWFMESLAFQEGSN